MAKRKKSKRGGARPGAGRPVTTGSKSVIPVSFRVSAADRSRLEAEAERRGLSVGQFASWATFRALIEPR